MKSSMFISLIIVSLFAAFIGCSDNPVSSDNATASVRLVPLTNNLAKDVFIGDDDNEYLPARHMPTLQKIAGSNISYDSINATTDLMYVLMNTGNVPVFNVNFTTNNLLIIPGTIGLLEVSSSGSQISALPIVRIVKEHVKPYSTVGSLLPFEVGGFTDTLTLSYAYEENSDTTLVSDIYPVSGTKVGAIINLYLSGKSIENYGVVKDYTFRLFESQWSDWKMTAYSIFSRNDVDTSYIYNSGNVPIRIQIISWRHQDVLLDTLLNHSDSLNTSGILDNDLTNSTGEIILIGEKYDQPYIFKFGNDIFTDGYYGIVISIE